MVKTRITIEDSRSSIEEVKNDRGNSIESGYRNTHEETFANLMPAKIRNGHLAIQQSSNKFLNDLVNEKRSNE